MYFFLSLTAPTREGGAGEQRWFIYARSWLRRLSPDTLDADVKWTIEQLRWPIDRFSARGWQGERLGLMERSGGGQPSIREARLAID